MYSIVFTCTLKLQVCWITPHVTDGLRLCSKSLTIDNLTSHFQKTACQACCKNSHIKPQITTAAAYNVHETTLWSRTVAEDSVWCELLHAVVDECGCNVTWGQWIRGRQIIGKGFMISSPGTHTYPQSLQSTHTLPHLTYSTSSDVHIMYSCRYVYSLAVCVVRQSPTLHSLLYILF